MKIIFLVIGFTLNIFFMWMPINSAQTPIKSKGLVRTQSGNYQPSTNSIAQAILNGPWQDNVKRHLFELAEWNARDIRESAKEKIYQSTARKFGKIDPVGLDRSGLPKLSDFRIEIPIIENSELKDLMSTIITKISTRLDNDIEENNQEIQNLQPSSSEHPEYKRNSALQKLLGKQLTTIKKRFNFTHDINTLKKNVENLEKHHSITKEENVLILKQLKQIVSEQTVPKFEFLPTKPEPKMEFPITEPAPEEQSSSSISTEELQELEKESKLPIIPYQQFSLATLFKKPETQKSEILPEKHISSSSSSSSSTESSEELIQQEVPQISQAPSQATEGEPSDTSEDNSSQNLEPNPIIPDVGLQTSDIPEPKQEPITPELTASTTPLTQSTKENPSVTPPSSMPSLPWYSRLMKQISAFFYAIDDFFWQIYG